MKLGDNETETFGKKSLARYHYTLLKIQSTLYKCTSFGTGKKCAIMRGVHL
jgi:hypothetical protein